MEYRIMGILSVALGISKPRDWPDMFGSFADAWTLRRLWGKSWHQIFRRPTIVHANFFLRSLGFSQSPRTSAERQFVRTFTLFSVFFLTGLIHYIGDAVWMQNLNLFDKNGPGAMHFYMLQPVGILLEDCVSSLFRRLTNKEPASNLNADRHRHLTGPPSWLARVIGYLWVVTWISLTLPLWTYPQFRQGFKNDMPHPKIIWRILGL
ncbi:hypothetical protein CPC08DRAFT_28012 [Agrocybe pediades]|nr:hypothetical protein CPC08DRAFT_28012 [Agrocybe pediades]